MTWNDIHGYAEEAALWSTLFINAWVILTGITFVIAKWTKRPFTQSDILILAGLTLPLVAFAFAGGFCWWLVVAGLYEEKVGPMPVWVQVLLFAVPTVYMLWYFVWSIKRQIDGKR